VILIGTLFMIGGGIHVAGTLRGTPTTNAVLMVIGTLLASLVGTTGAAMVMIRPLLKANRNRHHRAHTVVFFIFLVANIGGGLTPLGDPPLFLGFLHGVPFFWTLGLWRQVCFAGIVVLVAYMLHDLWYWSREPAHVRDGAPDRG
jgi:Na+/H+ antiporter NhaD/arsenite permease-like protein